VLGSLFTSMSEVASVVVLGRSRVRVGGVVLMGPGGGGGS